LGRAVTVASFPYLLLKPRKVSMKAPASSEFQSLGVIILAIQVLEQARTAQNDMK
jgi:hypothetical protein